MDLDFVDFEPYSTCLPVAMHTFDWTVECDDGCMVHGEQRYSEKAKFSNGVTGRMELRESCHEYADGVDNSFVVDFDILPPPDVDDRPDQQYDIEPVFAHMRVSVLDVDGNITGIISSPEQSDVMKLPERLNCEINFGSISTPSFRSSDEVIEKAKMFSNQAFAIDHTNWSIRLHATIWLYDAYEIMGI
jgi:hypothetical protein